MSTFLSLPFRKSTDVLIGSTLRNSLPVYASNPTSTYFDDDLATWNRVRKLAFSEIVTESFTSVLLQYNSLLLSVLDKFPPSVGPPITYFPLFQTEASTSITLCNLHLERLCVVFNLSALYSRLGDAASSHDPALAGRYYQLSAGTLHYLVDQVLPAVLQSHPKGLPADLTRPFFRTLQWVMLAQAQELLYNAKSEAFNGDGVNQQSAPKTSRLYRLAQLAILDPSFHGSRVFPSHWPPLLLVKSLYFDALALFMSAPKDVGTQGLLAAVVAQSLVVCENTPGIPNCLTVSVKQLSGDVRGATNEPRVQTAVTGCEVELPSSKVGTITWGSVQMAQPKELSDPPPPIALSLFNSVPPRVMNFAQGLYHHSIFRFVEDHVLDKQKKLDHQITMILDQLDIPENLGRFVGTFGLPPSLLAQALRVQTCGGNDEIYASISQLNEKSGGIIQIVKESLDFLQVREGWLPIAEDERFTKDPSFGLWYTKPPATLFARAIKQSKSLNDATDENIKLLDKWSPSESGMLILCQPLDKIELCLPPGPVATSRKPMKKNAERARSQLCAQIRQLSAFLDHLDTLKKTRAVVVSNALALAAKDCCPLVTSQYEGSCKSGTGLATAISQGLKKYGAFKQAMAQGESTQKEVIGAIKGVISTLNGMTSTDQACQERSKAIDSLKQAVLSYGEMTATLSQRAAMFASLEKKASGLRSECRTWANECDRKAQRSTGPYGVVDVFK